MGMLFQNATVVNPAELTETKLDILVENGTISGMETKIAVGNHRVIDCTDRVIVPGLVDMHVHFRDPGLTYKEDIVTGSAAAAAGGFTTVACMPNTKPVLDTPELMEYVLEKGEKQGYCHVKPIGAVTCGQKGQKLTDFAALKKAGAVAFSDDGIPIDSALRMREALQTAKPLGMAVISHCEDGEMVKNYAVNEGEVSKKLGLPGRPAVAEDLMVARDIMLAEETGAHVHIAHVSTKGSAELIRQAKAKGIQVTAETCPQYFIYTEQELLKKGTMARVNPPLRREEDRQAILAAVMDGTLDCIVTDHAPHSAEEKAKPLPEAPSGMVGLETSLAACLSYLVQPGYLTLPQLIRKMTVLPGEILNLDVGTLRVGGPADLCVIDLREKWTVDPEKFRSKGRSTVFAGDTLTGRVKLTLCAGKITYQDE